MPTAWVVAAERFDREKPRAHTWSCPRCSRCGKEILGTSRHRSPCNDGRRPPTHFAASEVALAGTAPAFERSLCGGGSGTAFSKGLGGGPGVLRCARAFAARARPSEHAARKHCTRYARAEIAGHARGARRLSDMGGIQRSPFPSSAAYGRTARGALEGPAAPSRKSHAAGPERACSMRLPEGDEGSTDRDVSCTSAECRARRRSRATTLERRACGRTRGVIAGFTAFA